MGSSLYAFGKFHLYPVQKAHALKICRCASRTREVFIKSMSVVTISLFTPLLYIGGSRKNKRKGFYTRCATVYAKQL